MQSMGCGARVRFSQSSKWGLQIVHFAPEQGRGPRLRQRQGMCFCTDLAAKVIVKAGIDGVE